MKRLIALVLLITACTTMVTTFSAGTDQLNIINERYGVGMKEMPSTIENSVLMRNELKELKEQNPKAPESFKMLLDYRIKSLESNIVHLKAWEHGKRATTIYGFGCRSKDIIINSSILRNKSVEIGLAANDIMQEFIDNYPEKAKSVNITQRDVVFSNYFFSELQKEAEKDRKIIEHFCEDEE